jgi:hypothetical protein
VVSRCVRVMMASNIKRGLNERFASTDMTRSSRYPHQFLLRSYCTIHGDMMRVGTTRTLSSAQSLHRHGMSGVESGYRGIGEEGAARFSIGKSSVRKTEQDADVSMLGSLRVKRGGEIL